MFTVSVLFQLEPTKNDVSNRKKIKQISIIEKEKLPLTKRHYMSFGPRHPTIQLVDGVSWCGGLAFCVVIICNICHGISLFGNVK